MGAKERFYVDTMALHPEVSGSCIPLVVKYPDRTTTKFLVDCGRFQDSEYEEYNHNFPFKAEEIDFCIITHNHDDHTGRLPMLINKNPNCKIYTSKDTRTLLRISLMDSYKIAKEEAKRHKKALDYSEATVDQVLNMTKGYEAEETVFVDEHIRITFFENGHLPGASIVLVQISYYGYEDINYLFTGDYNEKNTFFIPKPLPEWVFNLPLTVITEATYGTTDTTDIEKCFEKNIIEHVVKGGQTGVFPVLGQCRAQEILYYFKTLQDKGVLDLSIPIIAAGKTMHSYNYMYSSGKINICPEKADFFPRNLIYENKCIPMAEAISNSRQKIIVTTSGMGSHGPARTYLPTYLANPHALVHFTCYTAPETLGGQLKQHKKGDTVKIFGQNVTLNAEIKYTSEFSAHAKADQLIKFLKRFYHLKLVLINHGETKQKDIFEQRVIEEVSPKATGILGRDTFFRIGPYGLIRSLGSKFS